MTINIIRTKTYFSIACLLALVLFAVNLATGAQQHEVYIPEAGENIACALCHNCEFPTTKNLCLNKGFCIRSKLKNGNGELPEHGMMLLDELEKVYDPVLFSHGKHAQMSAMSGGCENCHHFAPPSAGHPPCKECHVPVGLRGKVQPGLKAAYHRQCLECHAEWDTESHCDLCHTKKVGGMSARQVNQLPNWRHQTPLEIKDLSIFETDFKDGDKVPFHHLNHVENYDRDCSTCHENEKCAACHVHGDDTETLGLFADVDLHDTCYKCHDKNKGCDECHGRSPNDLFDHAETGWILQPYHAVLQCKDCHHKRGQYSSNDPRCLTCHLDGWDEKHFNHGITGVILDQVHSEIECASCHVGGVGNHSRCDDCHDDQRKWDRKASFGPGSS
jgi:hypothetical protein